MAWIGVGIGPFVSMFRRVVCQIRILTVLWLMCCFYHERIVLHPAAREALYWLDYTSLCIDNHLGGQVVVLPSRASPGLGGKHRLTGVLNLLIV